MASGAPDSKHDLTGPTDSGSSAQGQDSRSSKKLSAWGQVARYSAIGLTIPSHLFAGWLIGMLLDKAFGTSYLYIVFVLIGVVSGFIEMIRLASRDPD